LHHGIEFAIKHTLFDINFFSGASIFGELVIMNPYAHKMDIGRLIILPVFGLLLFFNICVFYENSKALEPASTIKVAKQIHLMLIVCFYSLVVFLYFIRNTAKSTTDSLIAKTIAVIASFLAFAIPFLSSPSDNSDIMLFADLVTIFGMVFSIYSLSALGRSFSIIPQARTLVQTGPYKLVRHPLYLGEFISLLGIVLARFSISVMTIFCLIIALQIYRALQEERLLVGIFPEYEFYSLKKARFIPGIF
jgi:protein-S-isoprenylcysteine O-methyltransferase Ste14